MCVVDSGWFAQEPAGCLLLELALVSVPFAARPLPFAAPADELAAEAEPDVQSPVA